MIGPVEPFGTGHYIPMLRLAAAEMAGFADAVAHGADEITPLFRCEPRLFTERVPGQLTRGGNPRTVRREATDEEVLASLRENAGRIDAWSAAYRHPRFFIDCSQLDREYRRQTLRVVSDLVGDPARLVPMLSTDRAFEAPDVRDVAAGRGNGLALRLAARDGTGSADIRLAPTLPQIAEMLRAVEAEPGIVDAILDLGFVEQAFIARLTPLVRYVRSVYGLGWRTFTLLSGAVPRVPLGTNGERQLIRHDWNLYARLRAAAPELSIAFGDFTTKHPQAQIVPRGPQPYLTYTAVDFWWHFRRSRAGTTTVEAYRRICRDCVAKPEWMGPRFSDGDGRIAEYAGANAPDRPGSSADWLQAMFGHHLTFVSDQVRRAR